ncbi:MAG: hypothetical protein GX051_08495 [Clostridiales bacterium]|nr:hypothetical protein [Clostridiales bacterium]
MKERSEEYIQGLLDKGGHVFVEGGTYIITKPLIIGSNTELVLAPDAVFRLADKANCAILENASLSFKGEKRDKNITVRGGIWDGNNVNQQRRSREDRFRLTHYEDDFYYGILMRFVGVDNFRICDITVKDPDSYAMLLCATDGFTIENINLDYNLLRINMDGIHIQGPSKNGSVRNIRGTTNDDLVALNCDDTYACEITRGNIENVLVDGLYSENGYTGVRLLSSGSQMKNISIRNVFGSYRYYGVSFTHHNIHPGEPVWFDNILLDGIFVSKPEPLEDEFERANPIIWFESGIRAGCVTVRNVFRTQGEESPAPTVKLTGDIKINRLTLKNINESLINRSSHMEIDESCINEFIF